MDYFEIFQRSFNWVPMADAAAKATVLLAAGGLIAALLRKGTAASRHLVWTCALLAALAVPLLSIALPRWEVPLLTIPAAPATTAVEPGARPAPGAPSASLLAPLALPTSPVAPSVRSAAPIAPIAPAAPLAPLFGASAGALLAAVWLAGTVLILGRLVIGIVAVQWMARRTHKVTAAAWLPLARRIAAELGLSRVTFRRSEQPAMPMAWGIFRPSVLMPAEADSWPEDRLRIVLLHELAHVRRADCLIHILAQTACALHWMNPLAWVAAGRLRTERERACDDLVLASGTPGPEYAQQLLEIARAMGSARFPETIAAASLAMARRSQLEGRLMSILDPSVPRTGVSRMRTAIVTAIALFAIVPLASLQPWTYAEAAMLPQLPVTKPFVEPPPATTSAGSRTPSPAVEIERPVSQAGGRSNTADLVEITLEGIGAGVVQGVMEGVVESIPAAVEGALDAIGTQNPNPKPNPNPNPGGERSKADPKVVAALTEALKDTDQEVRESAMHALVQLRDPGIFEPLVQALKDSSPDVRESAAQGLAQLRDKRAVAPLTGALKDASADVREQAAFALGQLRDPAAVDGLAAALRDEDADVREQAAFALGQLRDERAIQPLMLLLKDADVDVREQAVFALGQLRARAAVDALIAALKDADAEVRSQAAFALGQIRDPKAIDALSAALKDASTEVRQQAAFALGQLAKN